MFTIKTLELREAFGINGKLYRTMYASRGFEFEQSYAGVVATIDGISTLIPWAFIAPSHVELHSNKQAQEGLQPPPESTPPPSPPIPITSAPKSRPRGK